MISGGFPMDCRVEQLGELQLWGWPLYMIWAGGWIRLWALLGGSDSLTYKICLCCTWDASLHRLLTALWFQGQIFCICRPKGTRTQDNSAAHHYSRAISSPCLFFIPGKPRQDWAYIPHTRGAHWEMLCSAEIYFGQAFRVIRREAYGINPVTLRFSWRTNLN